MNRFRYRVVEITKRRRSLHHARLPGISEQAARLDNGRDIAQWFELETFAGPLVRQARRACIDQHIVTGPT
jgi:hypothetical protein